MATINVRGTEKSVSLGIKNGEETTVRLTSEIRRAITEDNSLIDLDGVFAPVAAPVAAFAVESPVEDSEEPVAPVRRGRKS